MTLRDVATELGVRVSFVSDVEHGRKKPYGPEPLLRFCKLVGVAGTHKEKELLVLAARERTGVEISISDAAPKRAALAYALARTPHENELAPDTIHELMRLLQGGDDE